MVETIPFLRGVPYGGLITQLLYFTITLLAVWLITRRLVLPLLRRGLATRDVEPHAVRVAEVATSFLLFILALGVAFSVAGFRVLLASTATIVAALTVAVGFAAQDVVRDLAGGLFIFVERPFRIGDWIEWTDVEPRMGVVEDIRVRVTRVRTFDNELLSVPNSDLTGGVVKNVVAYDVLRIRVPFAVAYEDDVVEAERIIVDEAERHPDIRERPEPGVVLMDLGESSVALEARVWIGEPTRRRYLRVRGEYVQAVKARFEQAGIEIPFPQRDVSGTLRVEGMDGARREEHREALRG